MEKRNTVFMRKDMQRLLFLGSSGFFGGERFAFFCSAWELD
jgi:hypothetical protein